MSTEDDKAAAVALQKALGEAIRFAREHQNLGQVQIADSGNLSRLENGEQWVSSERLIQISRGLAIPIWVLFARAEQAINDRLWQVLDVFLKSDEEGQELIDGAVRTSKKYHLREKMPDTGPKGRRNHGV